MSLKDTKKLHYELKIVNDKIQIECFDDQTKTFLQKSWYNMVKQLYDGSQIQKIDNNFVKFNESLIYKDLKANKELLQNRLQNIRYTLTKEVYTKCIKEQLQRILSIKINIPHQEDENIIKKVPYKQFVLATQIREVLIDPTQRQSQLSFDTRNNNVLNKPKQQIVIQKGRSKNYLHNQRYEQMMMKLSKCHLYFYYNKEDHSKIAQIILHLEQYREEWLLYPMTPYLDQFSLDKIYSQELINKIIVKKFKDISEIVGNQGFQLLEKTVKLIKDDMFDRKSAEQGHFQLLEGYYLGFHIFGSSKNYHYFFNQIDQFFQFRRIWVLRPQKICCCPNIIDVQDYLKQKQNLEAYLISDHIIAIIKSQQQMEELTSTRLKQKLKKENIVSEEERLLKMLLTGVFVLDINDYDEEDLYYVYKERQGYKKFLQKQYGITIHYMSETTKLRISVRCQISAYRIFKGCIYSYINDMKKEKEQLPEFSTPFQYFVFNNYLKPQLEKEFSDIKFASKKKRNFYRLWVRFHSKDRSQLMDRLQEIRRQSERNLDYIVCKKQPICQQWFSLYRRPQTLSIQTLTCRKYIISKDTKIFVQPYQSLSRQVEEMLFLIDQSFQNCWQFTQIAQQNDINLMSLFLEFQQRKKKKPDRIKSIPLTNHRYIGKMVLWYNDMLKKIENRREQDLKKLYKRYEQKTEMHIMIPRHASTNILLHFVLPSFIKEFTQQTGYSLKQIHFYYPILFDSNHSFVEDLTMKIIDMEMRRANIELQNENFLQKESIKKIIEMDYVGLKCMFQDDQRVWKATNLASYIFFIEREILAFKKTQSFMQENRQDLQNHVPNFKVPIFFMDASFNRQVLVDLRQQAFYMTGKHIVEGPFELKSDKKYEQIFKCINAIKNIFLSLSYVVLYVDKDFNVGKNGFYYSHKQFMAEANNFMIKNEVISPQNQNKVNFAVSNVNFKKKKIGLSQNESKKLEHQKINKERQRKFIVFPMKIEILKTTNKRSHYTESGRIVKRGSRRLKIQIIESQLVSWYMAQTCKDKIVELEEYLRNPSNYKNNDNFLLEEISQYSILDMNEQVQKPRLLEFNQISRDEGQNVSLKDGSISMDSLDLSMISPAVSTFSNNEQISEFSVLKDFQNSNSSSLLHL